MDKNKKLFSKIFSTIREGIELARVSGISDKDIVDMIIRICKTNEVKEIENE